MNNVQKNSYESVKTRIHGFMVDSFLFGDATRIIHEDDSFLQKGIIDSTGILELIEFVEQEFAVVISSEETTPQNMDGLGRIARFIVKKQSEKESSAATTGSAASAAEIPSPAPAAGGAPAPSAGVPSPDNRIRAVSTGA